MKKLFLLSCLSFSIAAVAQNTGNSIMFTKGQKLEVITETKKTTTMDLMGQSMENTANTTLTESFDIEDVTESGAKIEYKVKRLLVNVDGMGRTQSFDSEKEGDRRGEMGKLFEKGIKNKFTMEVDRSGKVVSVTADDDNPRGKGSSQEEAMAAMIQSQVGLNLELPQVGAASVFKILPDNNYAVGYTWSETKDTMGIKSFTEYKIASITDTEIVIDFTENAVINTKQDMMGAEAVITGSEKGNGKIVVDKATGIFKSKTLTKESQANIEAQGMTIPTTDKTTVTVTVK